MAIVVVPVLVVTVPVTPPFRVKVAVPIVAISMTSLNMAEMAVFIATPVAPSAGVVEITPGAVVSDGVGVGLTVGVRFAVGVGVVETTGADSVVKHHEWLASRVVPAKFAACAPVVIVAV